MAAKRKAARPAPKRGRPTNQEWSKEWLALFVTVGGSPELFAKAVDVSYQTIWRIGLRGEPASKWTRLVIQQYATSRGLLSPV